MNTKGCYFKEICFFILVERVIDGNAARCNCLTTPCDKKADFFNFVVWGKTAENLANYMSKGALIGLKGRLSTRSYEDKNGQMKYVVEVVAENIEFLQRAGGKQQEQQQNYNTDEFQALEDDEDIPF